MEIDKMLVDKIAKNARLRLSEEETEKLIPQFKEILDMFAILDEVDTDKTEISMHPIPISNALRKDEVEQSFSQEKALSNVIAKKDGFFKGPKIL